jgi:hypothetical protein
METIVFHIPVYYLPYLINGDLDTISIDELTELNSFERELNKLFPTGYVVNVSEFTFFAYMNDINGLGSECVEYLVKGI